MNYSKSYKKTTKVPSPFAIIPQKTEWTINAKIAEWINQIVRDENLSIGLAEVETTIEGDRKRPDIILYERLNSQNILCCFEFKQPYFDPFNEEELKEPARKKATKRHSPYFVVSNYQKLIWYNTEKVNRALSDEQQICHIYDLSNIENIDLIERQEYKRSIISNLKQFLKDLVEVYTGKIPEPLLTIDEFLIFLLHSKVERLHFYYRDVIYNKFHKDKNFASQLRIWFAKQNWSFALQNDDFGKVARQTAYLLVNKIFFYYALRSKRKELDPLEVPASLTHGGLLHSFLQAYFSRVCKEIDYETIYSTDFIDQIAFPENREIVEEIKNLLKILDRFDFTTLKVDIIGRIFERLIPPTERHNLGQYFTDPDVVDLILQFCLKNEEDKVLDPACGSGTFLVRAYQRKKIMNQMLPHEEILKNLWGIDIAKFPAHLATINLAICGLESKENYPRIIAQDFFSLLPDTVEFKIPRKVKIEGLEGKEMNIEHPRYFDCVVGNPPYTRQEEIQKIAWKEGKYKENLIEKSLLDINNGKALAIISKRAGIHAYFFVHGTKFLHNKGRFGFIVSNSWLDVDYGKGLQEFFLKNYKIIAIIESKFERWFADADINTCIVILEKCAGDSNEKERDKNLVRFVYLSKPLRHFIPPIERIWERKVERKDKIDALIKTILGHSEFYKNNELRILPKSQKELWNEGFDKENNKYIGSKWGKYIRAPKIFFTILEKGKDKFVPLKQIADVRFGIKTGANEFFYLTEKEIKRRKIEKEFWMHKDEKGNWIPNYIIKSPKECKSIVIKPENLKYRVLMIHKDKKDLKGTNILKYIKEGERKEFHKRPTCASRKRWYELQDFRPDILWWVNIGERFACFYNASKCFVDKMFYGIFPTERKNSQTILSLLNTSLELLIIENVGQELTGALTFLMHDVWMVERLPILDPSKLTDSQSHRIKECLKKISNQRLDFIYEELGASSPDKIAIPKVKPDRRALDKIIMEEILGLTDEEQLEVYRAVVDLVRSRIIKANSVKLSKKIKKGLDIDLFIRDVMQEVGEETLGKFYKEKVLTHKPLYTRNLSSFIDKEVKIEKEIFGWKLSSKKEYLECSSEEEAKYLKIWVEAGVEKIKIPNDKNYLNDILPQLESLKQRIDEKICIYLDSILDQKFRSQIQHKLWQKIVSQ